MIDYALSLLRQGELVVIPTETVYGLAADASCPQAIHKIFALKGRPTDHPVIVHILGQAQITDWAIDIPPAAYQLAQAFWPGPLTLILRKRESVSNLITGNQNSIGLRAPAHPIAQQLLKALAGGLAAPSANRFGQVSPTTVQHVQAEFGANTPFILASDPALLGIESTIVSLIDTPTVLRPGSITRSQIEAVINKPVIYHAKLGGQKARFENSIRAPGQFAAHYAPSTPLILGTITQIIEEIMHLPKQKRVVIHHSPLQKLADNQIKYVYFPVKEASEYAHRLYARLREADQLSAMQIFWEIPPYGEQWIAIHDRLQRAATRRLTQMA